MTAEVRKTSAAIDAMDEDWRLIRALMAGTFAMRQAGKAYLPRWPAEEEEGYKARLKTATLFPAYARTVSVLTGKPFSKPITIGEDVPARMLPWLENVDLQNRNLHVFAADLCAEALAYGLCGVLVDYPRVTGAMSVADEAASGARPYLVHVRHDAILGWRAITEGGQRHLTQLRLLETVEEDDGAFGSRVVEQVRVLEPGAWAVWRKTGQIGDEWAVFDEGTTSLPVIPFVPFYGLRKGFLIGSPPMMELAHANVEHWQSKSDQQTILHVARVPILFARDCGEVAMSVGAGALISANSSAADLKYVEHSGAAIEAGRLSILDLEDRMRQIGAELLVIKPGNVTVAQTLADNEPGMCDLQRVMQGVEDGLDQVLALMAQWVGEPEGGHVSIYSDFGVATLAEASAKLLFDMWLSNAISLPTLLTEQSRRGILSPDIDLEEEALAARAEGPKPDLSPNAAKETT